MIRVQRQSWRSQGGCCETRAASPDVGIEEQGSRNQVPLQTSVKRRTIFPSVRWSLTGGLAAYALQRFYKGTDLTLFLDAAPDQIVRQLRLLPEANGPITLLRGLGSAAYWKEVKGITIAHPWLIYAELMRSPDPRAHEAATELKGEFLQTWSS
jgi:hypothetical protein